MTARQGKPRPSRVKACSLAQGQAGRSQAAAATKARLVDPHQAGIAGRARDLAMFNLAIDEQARQVAA